MPRLSACTKAACRKWVIWPLLPTLWLIPAAGWGEGTASIPTTIARAWKKREDRVFTLDCEWSAEQTTGAKVWVYHDERGEQFALPPNDLTVSAEYHFRLNGNNKMRYEYVGPQPNQATRSFQKREYVSVTDGKEQKCYYGKDEASEEPRFSPLGFINKKETLPENMTIHLRPLLVLYRPSAREVATALDFTKFSPKGQITVGGRECLLLERTGGGMDKTELVIDMNRDCVPVRIRSLLRDGSTVSGSWFASSLVEIDYVDQPDGSWRPVGWKTAVLGERGKVREQMRAVVKRFGINVDVPDSVFRFDFPVGTIVRNWKTNEHYLLRDGGEKRYITDAEADARVPYKRLLTTNTGEGLESGGRFSHFWRVFFVVVSSAILLLLIARLIYIRLRVVMPRCGTLKP